MAELKYGISFDLGNVLDITAMVNKEVFPLLNQAVNAVGQKLAANWQQEVYKAKLWSEEKDAYAASISWNMTGDFSGYVEATYKYAAEIETGRPARDLKKMLNTSLKVRRTESGKRFLVIPMRHNTPGNGAHAKAMPQAIYAMANQMSKSRVVQTGARPSGEVTMLSPKTGMHASPNQTPFLSNPATKNATMVARRSYAWGDRLKSAAMKQAGVDAAMRKRYAGMVRMETSTPGGAKSSAYMTFRIMMEGQTGWVIPAKPGLYIAKKVTDEMRPKAEMVFQEAIKRQFV